MTKTRQKLTAPLVGLGNKSPATDLIWERLGVAETYIEPFAYTCSVALSNPSPSALKQEILNDHNGFVTNFWRSIKHDYEQTAFYADMPISHLDFIAAEKKLLQDYSSLVSAMREHILFYDPKLAGLWAYYLALSIDIGRHLHIGDYTGARPTVSVGKGVSAGRKNTPFFIGGLEDGVWRFNGTRLEEWFKVLAFRLRNSLIYCTDWNDLFSNSMLGQNKNSPDSFTQIFFDPPYADAAHKGKTYVDEKVGIHKDVMLKAIDLAENERNRIIVCGYENDHIAPEGWTKEIWKGDGIRLGGQQKQDYSRAEAIWCSPSCVYTEQLGLAI